MADSQPLFADMLARARQGDRIAVTAIAQQYEPEIRIMARVLLGPALQPYFDSMDLVQSVHRSLLVHLRSGQLEMSRPEQLVALALTMIRRKVARQWRRHRRQQRLDGTLSGESLPQLLARLSGPDDDPVRKAQIDETVITLLRQLPPLDRQIMELRLAGFNTSEVAEQLGLDSDSLRVRLSRIRQRLRAAAVFDEWL